MAYIISSLPSSESNVPKDVGNRKARRDEIKAREAEAAAGALTNQKGPKVEIFLMKTNEDKKHIGEIYLHLLTQMSRVAHATFSAVGKNQAEWVFHEDPVTHATLRIVIDWMKKYNMKKKQPVLCVPRTRKAFPTSIDMYQLYRTALMFELVTGTYALECHIRKNLYHAPPDVRTFSALWEGRNLHPKLTYLTISHLCYHWDVHHRGDFDAITSYMEKHWDLKAQVTEQYWDESKARADEKALKKAKKEQEEEAEKAESVRKVREWIGGFSRERAKSL